MDLRTTAYHEAGHAVIAIRLGLRFRLVTVKPDGESLGHLLNRRWFHQTWQPDVEVSPIMRRRFEERIMGLLAGRVAERRFTGLDSEGDSDDFRQVVSFAERIASLDHIHLYLQWLEAETLSMVEFHWKSIQLLAEALEQQTTLSEREARGAAFPMPHIKDVPYYPKS